MSTSAPVITLHISGRRQVGKTAMVALLKEMLNAQGFQDVAIEQHPCMHIAPEAVLAQARESGFKPESIRVRIEDLDDFTTTCDEQPRHAVDDAAATSELMAKIKNSRLIPSELVIVESDQVQPFVNSQMVGRVIRYNPYTGQARDPLDVASDPLGFLILAPGQELKVYTPPVAEPLQDDPHFTIHPAKLDTLGEVPAIPEPIPMLIHCPLCSGKHIDEGKFASKPHPTHACQHCGHVWRPAVVPTVGVQFLPGYKQ